MKHIEAIAVLNGKNCKGTINIKELGNNAGLEFTVELTNLKPGLHGFHIHEAGNLEEGCKSCCLHFNPLNKEHGGPDDGRERHLGDLGNIEADKKGNCKMVIRDKYLSLRGYKYNILGRSVVVHEDPDDLGKGGNAESKKTGNAGARIGCGVIGYKYGYYHN